MNLWPKWVGLWLYMHCVCTPRVQIKEEVAKLLQLKAKLEDAPGAGKFVLKCPKVCITI